jgi:hypothetical protein
VVDTFFRDAKVVVGNRRNTPRLNAQAAMCATTTRPTSSRNFKRLIVALSAF